jgi:hypothetical protein
LTFFDQMAAEYGGVDVANVVRFLANENSGHVTGTYAPVCGGACLP